MPVATYPVVFVDFAYPGDLFEVGAVISQCLFNGARFGGFCTGIRDEVPAMRLEPALLGLEVVLHGYGGENGYTLEIEPYLGSMRAALPRGQKASPVDLSSYVAGLLSGLEGIQILSFGMVDLAQPVAAQG